MARVRVRDVAERAGVSPGTVSNALNHPERVRPELVAKVEAAIRELGFVKDNAAQQLRTGGSSTIGFVIVEASNPFFAEIARGANAAAFERDLAILQGNSAQNPERERGYLDLFEEQRVRGIIMSSLGDSIDRLRRIRDRGQAVVLINRLSADRSFSSVTGDDRAGGFSAVEHLLELGRRRIAFVGLPDDPRQVVERLAGAELAAATVPDATLEVVRIEALGVSEGRRAALDLLSRPASTRPDAVFAANDWTAIGVLQAASVTPGVAVPENLALIGYDDIEFAKAASVPLTSVRQPGPLMGRTAVELLVAESEDPSLPARQVIFQHELVVRESTIGPART